MFVGGYFCKNDCCRCCCRPWSKSMCMWYTFIILWWIFIMFQITLWRDDFNGFGKHGFSRWSRIVSFSVPLLLQSRSVLFRVALNPSDWAYDQQDNAERAISSCVERNLRLAIGYCIVKVVVHLAYVSASSVDIHSLIIQLLVEVSKIKKNGTALWLAPRRAIVTPWWRKNESYYLITSHWSTYHLSHSPLWKRKSTLPVEREHAPRGQRLLQT